MHIPTEAEAIEKRLRAANISVAMFLAEAQIDRSTWTRWKGGSFEPRFSKWEAVKAAASKLLDEEAAA